MNPGHVLSVLYDLALTMGAEVRLEPLLTRVLQRLLFHTAFPAGLVLLDLKSDEAGATSALCATAVGDHRLAGRVGQRLALHSDLLAGEVALLAHGTAGLAQLDGSRPYTHALRLPIEGEGLILLLAPGAPHSDLPLTQLFQPVLRNLTKAMGLCRASEELTQRLVTDRDQARHDLALALQRSEQERTFLRNLTDTFPDLVWIKDPNGIYLGCNPHFERLYGHKESEILGRSDTDFVPADQAEFFRRNDLAAMSAGQPCVNEEWLTFAADGYRGLFETTKVPMHDAQGRLLGVLGVARDITERRRAETQQQLAASVFTHAREGIMITSPDGTIIDVNDTFTEITGYSRAEAVGNNPRMLQSGRQTPEFYANLWRDLRERGNWSGEIWNRRKNGEVFAELMTISAVQGPNGELAHYVALFSDISKLKQHERRLEQIAHYDPLTLLPNRVLLADRLQQAMAQAHRRGQSLAVAYVDLDGFKAVNEHRGHEVGDQYLAEIAVRMRAALREGDTLARLGGDEFVVVLMDLANAEESVPLLAKLIKAAAEVVELSGGRVQLSASAGVTLYPQAEVVDADQLMRQADQAMYQAKLAGRNRYHFFDPEQDRSLRGHHESIDQIRHALEAGQFVLHYQPRVNLHSGAVIGAEALIRWQHPTRGLLLPAHFLPVIENHPLAVDVGDWVIHTALSQVEHWREQGLDLPVSVNVSARQLQQADFVDHLRATLAAHPGANASRLELEILETSALQDVNQVSQVLSACAELGVTCSLDDFGTGYSSLSYLKRLPAQVLKIDQSFVRDMLHDPDDLAILEGVLGLATAFHRQAVAEGMETAEHGVMLLQLGCRQAQGYGIARPMPAGQVPNWVHTWQPDPRWARTRTLGAHELPVLYAGIEHRAWVAAVDACVQGRRQSPPEMGHDRCRFSEWLAMEAAEDETAREALGAVDLLHRRVHSLAADVLGLSAARRDAEALALADELHELRDALLTQLDALLSSRALH